MAAATLLYDFSPDITEPPAKWQIRFNAGHPYTTVTHAWIRYLTRDDRDMKAVFLALPVGTTLYIQDQNESAKFARFITGAAVLEQTDYADLLVSYVSAGDALTAQPIECVIITDSALPPIPPGGGQAFVTLDEAKFHLYVADPALDDRVQAYSTRASGLVWNYLEGPQRPETPWTSDTAPPVVQAATLKLLGALWEHRGDDLTSSTDYDAHVWDEVARLLMRMRDPAIA